MPNKKFFILLALILTSLACTISIGGPEYPDTNIPVSSAVVEEMQAQFKAAFEAGAKGEPIILTFTEKQLTSLLSQKFENEENPFFTEPQVHLRDGKMTIYGKATQGYFVATIKVVVLVLVDENGQPDMRIESADFGPFPAPESLSSGLSAIITEAYTGAAGPVATGFRIEQVAIGDGFLAILGKVK
ncbi:MAG: hypothetical protein HN392_06115 [Anaerolineae bacterium]|nr:hypothetical protein [Anaerolineae bacterium]MBT7073745.1 hypothetical protein [Anaerolineae bacterium]MBT7782179.1 hypothetical protein [Anaerolineae bacterium]